MNLRDTPIYAKHFAADSEPEEHARISIEYVQSVLSELIAFMTQPDAMGSDRTLFDPVFNKIIVKQQELHSHLKPTE